jgi:hypothetical protein
VAWTATSLQISAHDEPTGKPGGALRRQDTIDTEMWEIVFGVIGLVGLVIGVLWLIGLPGQDDEEELAGLVTANWDEVKSRIDNN